MALIGNCGAVTITVPGSPVRINVCRCDFCRRVGARWGSYTAADVTVTGPTDTYRRAARGGEFHRCATLTHWIKPARPRSQMGVHMANLDPVALAGIPVVEDP